MTTLRRLAFLMIACFMFVTVVGCGDDTTTPVDATDYDEEEMAVEEGDDLPAPPPIEKTPS